MLKYRLCQAKPKATCPARTRPSVMLDVAPGGKVKSLTSGEESLLKGMLERI